MKYSTIEFDWMICRGFVTPFSYKSWDLTKKNVWFFSLFAWKAVHKFTDETKNNHEENSRIEFRYINEIASQSVARVDEPLWCVVSAFRQANLVDFFQYTAAKKNENKIRTQ